MLQLTLARASLYHCTINICIALFCSMLHSIKGENSLYGISLNVEMKVLYNQKLNFKTQL